MLNRALFLLNFVGLGNDYRKEHKETPEAKEKADPAHKLYISVRICWRQWTIVDIIELENLKYENLNFVFINHHFLFVYQLKK